MSDVVKALQRLTKSKTKDISDLTTSYRKKFPENGTAIFAICDFFFNENQSEKYTNSELIELLNLYHKKLTK